MPKPRAILKRRKAIQNIAKITKTMQMISTAKFKRAFSRAVAARPYTDRLSALVADLSAEAGDVRHPLLEVREPRRVVLLAIASNRGLCGGYNVNILRLALADRREAMEAGREVRLLASGKKLSTALRFAGTPPAQSFTQMDDKPTFAGVEAVVGPIVSAYESGEVDEVRVVYTRFESSARQHAV